MKQRYFHFLYLLGILSFYGCSENTNNPDVIGDLSSFENGMSSETIYSSFENTWSSSWEQGVSSSDHEVFSSSSEIDVQLSSSSGIDYSNWVLKKEIYWNCDDASCITKKKSSETIYDYISYTDAEHYTVISNRYSTTTQTSQGVVIHKTWNRDQTTTTRNGLNYSGTEINQKFTPDSLTLSYKREISFSRDRHFALIWWSIRNEEMGSISKYSNGLLVDQEIVNSIIESHVIDLGLMDEFHCYKYAGTSVYCVDDYKMGQKSENYDANGNLKNMATVVYTEILNYGEFSMVSCINEMKNFQNDIWITSYSTHEITDRTKEKIMITIKYPNQLIEQHYGLP